MTMSIIVFAALWALPCVYAATVRCSHRRALNEVPLNSSRAQSLTFSPPAKDPFSTSTNYTGPSNGSLPVESVTQGKVFDRFIQMEKLGSTRVRQLTHAMNSDMAWEYGLQRGQFDSKLSNCPFRMIRIRSPYRLSLGLSLSAEICSTGTSH